MPFSIGGFELLAILAVAIPTMFLHPRGNQNARWLVAATACLTAATVMTPADLLSTTILASALLAAFALGLRSGTVNRSPTS